MNDNFINFSHVFSKSNWNLGLVFKMIKINVERIK
jgi:hypothetical protein